MSASKSYGCVNCRAKFFTKMARNLHESNCIRQRFSSTMSSSSSLPATEKIFVEEFDIDEGDNANADYDEASSDLVENDNVNVDYDDVNEKEAEEEDEIERFEEQNLPAIVNVSLLEEDNILKVIRKCRDIELGLTDYVSNSLKLFYQNKISLSSCDEPNKMNEGGVDGTNFTGIKVYIPTLFKLMNKVNPVAAAHKRVLYNCNKHLRMVIDMRVKTGPFLHNNSPITMDSLITYRPIKNLPLTLLHDDQFTSLGTYCFKPIDLKETWFCATYNHTEHYKKAYNKIINHFGDGSIPFPVMVWCDGASYIPWNKQGSAHTISIIPVLFSLPQINNHSRGSRVWSLCLNYDLDKDVPSVLASNIRTMNKAKYMAHLFNEMNELTSNGLVSSKGKIVPYICYISSDLVEMRSLSSSLHCGICDMKNTSKRVHDEVSTYDGSGIKLQDLDKDKIVAFENFQSDCVKRTMTAEDKNKIYEHTKQMIKFQEQHGRKMIRTCVEHMNLPYFMNDLHPSFVVDRLHVLLLNEGKLYVEDMIKTMSSSGFKKVVEASRGFKHFPVGFLKQDISNLTGSQIARGMIMLVALLYDHRIPIPFASISIFKEKLRILEALCLITVISGKELVTSKVEMYNVSDLSTLKSKISHLCESKYFMNEKRDNTHLFLDHFCNLGMWSTFGSPRYYSSSIGEASLARLKRTLQVSNKRTEWRRDLLTRVSVRELYLPAISKEPVFNWLVEPHFIKVAMFNGTTLEIGYVDANRGNLYNRSNSVLFQTYQKETTHYAIGVKSFRERIIIDQIIIMNPNQINAYYELEQSHIYIKGRLLDEIPNQILEKYRVDGRGIPDLTLWSFLSPSTQIQIHVKDLIGGCFHREMFNSEILGLCNHQHSHYVSGWSSEIQVPDIRFG